MCGVICFAYWQGSKNYFEPCHVRFLGSRIQSSLTPLSSFKCSLMYYFFIKVATAMFGYMTDLETVEVVRAEEITAEGISIV